jgi:tripartite-type tricarboxylate transporter receptor subunit TctC
MRTAFFQEIDMRLSVMGAGIAGALFILHGADSAAQTYPSRPVRMIVTNGAGSAPDVIARLLANKMSASMGQSVVVDNRPGATGLIAVEIGAKSAPDGHTLIMVTMTNLIATLMYQKYMLATELGAVTLVGTTPFAFVVNASTPVKNVAEWIAYAKARPGKLRFGSAGSWGSSHLCMENFNAINGLKMTHVPYANTMTTMSDLMSGAIHIYCPAVPQLPPFMKSGKVRVLGVTYREPTKLLPGVPPVADTVKGFGLYGWYGINVPRKTPPAIVKKINAELVKALKDPALAEKMLAVGAEAVGSTPEEFAAWLDKDTKFWTKSLRDSGAKLGQTNAN